MTLRDLVWCLTGALCGAALAFGVVLCTPAPCVLGDPSPPPALSAPHTTPGNDV